MSLAKKCNRCGAYYDYTSNGGVEKQYNGVVTVWIDSTGNFSNKEKLDFCPKCKDGFYRWLSMRGEAE